MMKRVLQVNLEDAGGAFSLMFQVQKQLKDEYCFDYFSMGNFNKDKVREEIGNLGGEIYGAELRKNRLLGHVLLPVIFKKFLEKNKYNVVHIHSDTAWKLFLYAFPAMRVGIPKIIVHSHCSNVNGDFRWLKKICHHCAKHLLPQCSTVLLSCSDLATVWMYDSKVEEKVIQIHNGIDTEKFKFSKKDRDSIRERLGLHDDEILIGTVGNFSYQKNPFFLLDVFSELMTRYKDEKNPTFRKFRLIFVGEGIDKDKVEIHARKLNIYDEIIFFGGTFDVAKMYSAMDCFVMTSRFEGLPMSAIEAQTSGLKCFLSDRISKNTRCLSSCEFIDITDKKLWADKIVSFDINNNREDAWREVINKGYDIANTSNELKRVYS